MLQEIAFTICPEKAVDFRNKLDETAATPEMWEQIKIESRIKDRDRLMALFEEIDD